MIYILGLISFITLILISLLYLSDKNKHLNIKENQEDYIKKLGVLEQKISSINVDIHQVPSKVLNTVRGATNKNIGEFGELIAALKIKDSYDKILYLGDVCDFVGIKYPTDKQPGCIHFIEIKTGKAVLSNEQKKLRNLIDNLGESIKHYNTICLNSNLELKCPEILFNKVKITVDNTESKNEIHS